MELSLDSAHRFFLPDHTLRRDDWWIFLFNGGGKNQTERVRRFLTDFLPLLEQAAVFPEDAEMYIRSPRYLFLYDADHNSPDSVWDWARTQFSSIAETSWEWGEWTGTTTTSEHAGDKGVHVWAGSEGRGTLEDILQEMIEHSGRGGLLESALAWMDENFEWDVDAEGMPRRFAERARRRKAIVTACGQREKPGFSMNVIVGQTRLIPETEFWNNERIVAFADFVSGLTGFSPLENPEIR